MRTIITLAASCAVCVVASFLLALGAVVDGAFVGGWYAVSVDYHRRGQRDHE